MTTCDYLETPLGRMLLVSSEKGLCGAHFIGQKHFPKIDPSWKRERSRAARELAEYFDGKRTGFTVPLAAEGTPFQRAIWKEIAKVRFGETITYAELARRAGFPGCARAAGAATGRNPLGVIVPCHRIVGADGSLTGYAGGLAKKKALLALERGEASPSRRRPLRAAAAPARPG